MRYTHWIVDGMCEMRVEGVGGGEIEKCIEERWEDTLEDRGEAGRGREARHG